ncbi:MAG: hypothetical protein IJV27_04805 [Prevotella sp.]|nr:hypothetical protein [Prevotella sp.]
MTKRLYILALLAGLCTLTRAATADSALVEHTGIWRQVDALSRVNPALHGAAYNASFSQLAVSLDWQKQSEAFIEEKGDGYLLPEISVNTYLRLSEQTAVWGKAAYMNGKQRNIRWNSTTDYDLLEPYVLADTLGGNTQRERYQFSGGYATQLNRVLLGVEMLFRAEHEYRDYDPRMRGIVNDLTLRFGAGYDTWGYRFGASFEGNIYKQTNDVDFYREEGVIPEHQMTGLGTEYGRFSGDKRTLYYKGGGISLQFDANPLSGNGFYGNVTLAESRHRRVIAELNSMPLTDLYRDRIGLTAGWKHSGRHDFADYGKFDFTERSGDEHIAGTSAATYFPIIGKLTMYKNYLTDASLTAIYGQNGKRDWHVSARFGYQNNRQRYVYPERLLSYSRIYGMLSGEMFIPVTERLNLKCNLNAAYFGNTDSNIVMPFVDMQAHFTQMINHHYEYSKANYTQLGGQARGDYALSSRYGLFAEAGFGAVFCSVGEHQTDLHLAIGVTF